MGLKSASMKPATKKMTGRIRETEVMISLELRDSKESDQALMIQILIKRKMQARVIVSFPARCVEL